MTAGPQTVRSLHEICESARQQPAAAAALCRTIRVRSAPVIVMRTANAVGLYGPPGFKSPILRLLSSSYAQFSVWAGCCFLLSGPLAWPLRGHGRHPAWLLTHSSPAPRRRPQSCPDTGPDPHDKTASRGDANTGGRPRNHSRYYERGAFR